MELRQLEYFVAVVEQQSFTDAAEVVHISQSGVSAQIRQLERELGAQLLDRSTRTIRPTVAGSAALPAARAALAAAAAVKRSVGETLELVSGELRVAMVAGCDIAPWFAGLAEFHRRHPGIAITLTEGNSDHLIEGVRAGRIDLALVGYAGDPPDDLTVVDIVREELTALIPRGHELDRAGTLTIERLAHQLLVCLPTGTGIRSALDHTLARHGLAPDIACEASSGDAVIALTARGFGVGILSPSMIDDVPTDIRLRPIRGRTVPAALAVIRHPSSLNPAAPPALSECLKAFDTQQPSAHQLTDNSQGRHRAPTRTE